MQNQIGNKKHKQTNFLECGFDVRGLNLNCCLVTKGPELSLHLGSVEFHHKHIMNTEKQKKEPNKETKGGECFNAINCIETWFSFQLPRKL